MDSSALDLLGADPSQVEGMKEALWGRGDIDYIFWPKQAEVFREMREVGSASPDSTSPMVMNCHRGFGKTFFLLLLAFRRCLKYPGQWVRFGCESQKQCAEIVLPNVEKLMSLCPERYMPEKRGDWLCFQNPDWPKRFPYMDASEIRPSRLTFVGCREDAYNHRGKRSNMVILDECRDIDNFEYVVRTVFGPHFAKMSRPVFLMASTPPHSTAHAFTRVFIDEARHQGRYWCVPSPENPDWTERDDRMMEGIVGKKGSLGWRIEMGCELISDPSRLVVPEFQEREAEIVRPDWPQPQSFQPLVVGDGGYVDFFAVLFGYVDFKRNVLVYADELLLRRTNTKIVADAIRKKELELWGQKLPTGEIKLKDVPIRSGDFTPREIADLSELFGLYFQPAPKDRHSQDSRESHVAIFRAGIQEGKVVIKPACKHLIAQLKEGVRNESGKFERTDEHGHLDAIAAATYMYKVAPWHMNPYPPQSVGLGQYIAPDYGEMQPFRVLKEENWSLH